MKHDEELLTTLLQYNAPLTDEKFVISVVAKIESKNNIRNKLLSIALFIAIAISIPFLADITKLIHEVDNFIEYCIGLLVITLTVGVWITSEDF